VTSERTTAWVVKTGDSLLALGPRCTHLGCAYHWEDARHQFVCPCHASVFSVDGKVVSGPAPRPLDRYDTRVENGRLLIGPLHESGEAGA
jgi:menaquinol-cytochrome c reductase iron-sulfur subunit